MQLHFLTRDIRQDYPRIGWLPPLPAGADDLWLSFGNLHAGDYPEILLSRHNGEWQLFLSAMNSGRTDFISTPIRVSFFISGHAGETDAVLALIRQYLLETVLKSGDSPLLKNIFQTKIKPGDPGNWTTLPTSEQETIAADLLEEICRIPASPSADVHQPPPRWVGGCTQENINLYLFSCRELLSGQAEGMTLSLANLSESEVPRVLRQLQPNDHAAILLTVPDEKDMPMSPLTPPKTPLPSGTLIKKGASNKKNNGMTDFPDSGKSVPHALFLWLGGLLLLFIVLILTVATHTNQKKNENGSSPLDLPQTTNDLSNQSDLSVETP